MRFEAAVVGEMDAKAKLLIVSDGKQVICRGLRNDGEPRATGAQL